jgi:hypothetical protein
MGFWSAQSFLLFLRREWGVKNVAQYLKEMVDRLQKFWRIHQNLRLR